MWNALASGAFGVRLSLAKHHQLRADEGEFVEWLDGELGVVWYAFFRPALTLDLSAGARPSLQRDVRAHAEFLRDEAAREAPHDVSGHHPLVSCDQVAVRGGPALEVIHYLVRRPGDELVMGHLLVPVADGLFEARCVTRNFEPTGTRESALMMQELTRQPGRDPEELMRSISFNDPRYDELFPAHVISRLRRALGWVRSSVVVERPAAPVRQGPVRLSVGCTVTPPPRFALYADDHDASGFARASLACTDGVQTLVVVRAAGAPEAHVAEVLAQHGLPAGRLQHHGGVVLADGGAQRRVAVVPGKAGPQLFFVTLTTTPAHPVSAIVEELSATARSLSAR